MQKILTEKELSQIISESIQTIMGIGTGKILSEGVRYDDSNDSFIFDFEDDKSTDIIQLKKVGYKISAFNHCYYYGYGFEPDIESSKRSNFIHSLKFPDGKISESDKKTFIVNAVNKLDSDISLPAYKLIVYPESMSELNREMLKYLNRFASPNIANMELIKSLPSKIEFDYDRFYMEILDAKLPNGRCRYSQKQKDAVIIAIKEMMNRIHGLQYFSIARDVRKSKYRQYIKNYYSFKDESDRKLFESILNSNILIIDDIVTSGSTLSNVLNCLRSINDSNNIVIFSLIGKEI